MFGQKLIFMIQVIIFIGSYLAEAYLARGDEVYVIDDLSTGSLASIKPFARNPLFHFINDTILNRETMPNHRKTNHQPPINLNAMHGKGGCKNINPFPVGIGRNGKRV
jgi:UDP-glucose 4-epimerase